MESVNTVKITSRSSSSKYRAVLIAASRLQIPEMPSNSSRSQSAAGTPAAARYSRPAGSLNRRTRRMQSASSMAATASVLRTLCTQGTCLSPIPSIRWPPKPLSSSVGHCSASVATTFSPGKRVLRKSPAAMVPAEPVAEM